MENAHDMRFIFYHKRNIDEGRDSVYTFVNMLEQAQIDVLDKLELQRRNNVGDICKVLNLSPEGIRVNDIIEILRKRPKEHDALSEVHMKLKKTIDSLVKINENNKSLLKESMDMIEFEMNLAKSIILGPQTNNYDNAAYEQGSASVSGRFDAKQ